MADKENESDNKILSDALGIMERIIQLTETYPHLRAFCEGKIQYESCRKPETKLADYQYTESIIERTLSVDRKHPLETVKINAFNAETDSSLGEVKIIYGPSADEYTRSHHALALAVADMIFFRNGAYKPETEEGQKLLAHELTHVKQYKERGLTDNATKDEKEAEAEQNEKLWEYDPDERIGHRIEGEMYSFTEKEWKQIRRGVEKDIEEWLEHQKNILQEEDWLKLLCKYVEWERRGNRIWR